MLRVLMEQSADSQIFRLQGRFTGEEAEHVRMLVPRCLPEMKLVVDVTDVMFIDSVGEDVLLLLKRLGAEFVADNAYTLDICEYLNLPLARNDRPNTHGLGVRMETGAVNPSIVAAAE
jgi:STAS domain-containing protein